MEPKNQDREDVHNLAMKFLEPELARFNAGPAGAMGREVEGQQFAAAKQRSV